MGNDVSNSVVNHKLQVHGIQNLRVVDASVMPGHVSGHTMASTAMIAEKAADIIKENYKKAKDYSKLKNGFHKKHCILQNNADFL